MPVGLDIKIRLRIFRAYFVGRRALLSAFSAGLLVPILATYMFVVKPVDAPPLVDTGAIVASVYEAQAAEITKSETGIYHVKRIIKEGSDKPAFVTRVAGEGIPAVTERVDEIETWQHNDTALALIESNGTAYGFEAFLSLEHDGELQLHHYGGDAHIVDQTRKAYDAAHDLATLYTEYKSLERPGVPVLPKGAQLQEVTSEKAFFVYRPVEGLEIEAVIDLKTKLVVEEIIYVLDENGDRFEMTTVLYADRSVIPAEEFEKIFDPSQYEYAQVS